jgi:CHAT domain-containing protein
MREIARLFDRSARTCALGVHADWRFLRTHGSTATHLHLACHGSGSLFDIEHAGVLLSDGPVAATALTQLAPFNARLAVMSACQTALADMTDDPDEVLSVATALLVAGSAGAIATLWPVDDLATAILMTNLYEEIIIRRHRPPEALRRAQRWLQRLTELERDVFLDAHPDVAAEYRRRLERHADGRAIRSNDRGNCAYSNAEYWAAFVAWGC